ncbi:hypothetical protein [uncultured Shimia sp.]|uniref:hypothetical protein n=1 Tax=uncultured Shimia sp. TaxID=573152 RepID=UPI0026360C70|nr:hypothetical protein [uncultured Shimia sp.]
MRPLSLIACLICLATPALSDLPLACDGEAPEWHLTLAGPVAQFDFVRKNDFEVPQSNTAEGRDWPKAYTLISEFDTAIVLIDEASCEVGGQTWPITAHILTQRGQQPILLTGCCTVAE